MIDAIVGLYDTIIGPVSVAVLVYFAGLTIFSVVLYASASFDLYRFLREVRSESYTDLLSSELVPSVTILMQANDEEKSIGQSVEALLTLHHPRLEIVVIDDGSTDGTLDCLIEAFDLEHVDGLYEAHLETELVTGIYHSAPFPNLVVASKERGGKADALNLALNLAESDLVCAVDADTLLDPDSLQRLVRPFLRSEDVVAAGATIRVVNGCAVSGRRSTAERAPRNLLAGIQVVENLRAFLFGRPGWNRLGGNLVIAGALGLFRRDRLREIGGYTSTVGEDMELVIRLRRDGCERNVPARVEFIPDPVAWTEAPASLAALSRQRERWHRGLSECLWRHRRVLGNRRYGALGLFVYPAFLLFEWLAPVIELAGLILIPLGVISGDLSRLHAVVFFAMSLGLGLLLSLMALLLEELSFRRSGTVRDRAMLLVYSVVEMVGYRQMTLHWRLRGIVDFLRRERRSRELAEIPTVSGLASPHRPDSGDSGRQAVRAIRPSARGR